MINKENVINGLECCTSQKPNSDCKKSCPFYSSYSTSRCRERLHADAIALLKGDEVKMVYCDNCGFEHRALDGYCPKCGEPNYGD